MYNIVQITKMNKFVYVDWCTSLTCNVVVIMAMSQTFYHVAINYDEMFVKCNLHPKTASQFCYWD